MLLIHGFGSDVRVCWRLPGWIEALTHAGRRVIAFDMRGHGQSTKLYDPAHYSARLISEDAAALLEHLSVERVDVLGYSFGALIGAFLSLDYPSKVKSLVLGGLGMALNIGVGDTWEKIIRTFHGSGKKEVKDLDEKYEFSSRTRPDVQALAACMYVLRETLSIAQLSTFQVPVLVAVGEKDEFAGSAHDLSTLIPKSDVLVIPGVDHMGTIGSPRLRDGVLKFLGRPC